MNRQDYYQEPWGGNDDLHKDGCLPMLIWGIIAALVCALIGSCKTKYVTVPEYHEVIVTHHDTLTTRDSIFQKDSVFMWMQGDTVWKEKFSILYKDRWRERIVYRDSVKVDSVRVPYPVITNKVSFMDKIKYSIIGVTIIFVISILIRLVSWFRARGCI